MGELIEGDDGFPAEDVDFWVKEKHELLCRYIDISRAARAKYLGPRKGGAAYVDPFCGPGRARIRSSGEWIDGGCVAAWRQSVKSDSPFSMVLVGDIDEVRLKAASTRLRALGAPVFEFLGPACDTAKEMSDKLQKTQPHGLHFSFLDPFSLGALNFEIVRSLSTLKRMDMMVHVNKMDLQRNLDNNISYQYSSFESFAPGWRSAIDLSQSQKRTRVDIMDYWLNLVSGLGAWASAEKRLITGSRNQPLYWLLLAAKHDLAHQFWKSISKTDQGDLFS